MSRDGSIRLEFGGEEREFRLGLGALRKLQEKTDAGPAELIQRLAPYVAYAQQREAAKAMGLEPPGLIAAIAAGALGTWRVDDARETLLQGLIDGGLSPNEAGRLIRDNFDGRPLIESLPIAFSVLLAAVVGVDDEIAAGESVARASETSPSSRAAN